MSETLQHVDTVEELAKAADTMMGYVKDEGITDARKAGQCMSKAMEKHNIVLEGDDCEGERQDYIEVNKNQVLVVMNAAQEAHNHELEQ